MKQPFKLVYVEWEDAFGCSSSWTEIPEVLEEVTAKPLLARSVGWVIRDKGTSITVVPHMSLDHAHAESQGCGDMTIPRSAIRKMVNLDITDSRVKRGASRVLRNSANSKRAKVGAGRGLVKRPRHGDG